MFIDYLTVVMINLVAGFRCGLTVLDHRPSPVVQLASARQLQRWLWRCHHIVRRRLSRYCPRLVERLESDTCGDLCLFRRN